MPADASRELPDHVHAQIGRLPAANKKWLADILADCTRYLQAKRAGEPGAHGLLEDSLRRVASFVDLPGVLKGFAGLGPTMIAPNFPPDPVIAGPPKAIFAWKTEVEDRQFDTALAALKALRAALEPTPSNLWPEADAAENSLCLVGAVWHVRYEEDGKVAHFADRQDSVLRHLARLLAEPNRRFSALDFRPPPPDWLPPVVGAARLAPVGQDASSDAKALRDYERELRRLAQEIKEADDAHDAETAARLRAEFDKLKEHLDRETVARRLGHKKQCGSLGPEEKADQALRMGLRRLTESLRKKGLPKLADHLDKYLDNTGGEWWYAPPPGTSHWHVPQSDPSTADSGDR
jgi:hypothetical protein